MLKKILTRTLILLIIAFVVIQFFHPEKNLSAGISEKDISKLYAVPEDVDVILKASCFDCHSNNTGYPWYAKIQPVAWWLNDHIQEGKKHLNFSEFAGYRIRRQYKKLEEINEMVKDDEMPLESYTLIHRNSILSDAQKNVLYTWVNQLRDSIKANYPADSLLKRK